MNRIRAALFAAILASVSGAAQAAVTISGAATANMTCTAGICAPTADGAVLNVTDLETLLAAGDVTVETTANGVEADDIRVAARLQWTGGFMLSLIAHRSVRIDAPVTALQRGGATITTNEGDLTFGPRGRLNFRRASSKFLFNGEQYQLARNIGALAALIAANPGGQFALANDYNLTNHYTTSPIATALKGKLEGLGHTIANLEISTTDVYTGLFQSLNGTASVRDLKLANVTIYSENSEVSYAGALAGYGKGTAEYIQASGVIASNFWLYGGGIFGVTDGDVTQSFANVNVSGGDNSELGGLVGNTHGVIKDCYALGPANGGDQSYDGGLLGAALANVKTSYSTGGVEGGQSAFVGGLAGTYYDSVFTNSYWDTSTSGSDQGTGLGDVDGLEGLTTEQLQSGLPQGFDPQVWTEKANINGGLPYLINNAPAK